MPCTKCSADFNLLTWKIKCIDCEQYHCSKCLRKLHGSLFCEKCVILNKRPPDRERLMELRAKDLRDYLTKNKISTHGLVEKSELVELFYRCSIPVRNRKYNKGLSSVLTGSVPNLASQSQDHINNIRTNLEDGINSVRTNISNARSYAENALHNLGTRVGPNTSNDSQQSPNFSTQQNTFFYTTTGHSQPTSSSSSSHDIQQETNNETANASSSSPHKYPKLSDYATVDELNELSVKQLKELLTLNRVDFKGCVEKSELLDRATRLWNDNNQYRNEDLEEASVDNLCKICMDAPLDCVILECGHMATCVNCGKQLAECPICRQYVTRVVRTFKA